MAAFLGVNVRTLARYLEKEGASFQPLLDETRYLMARELLQITELPVGDVADALSYSSHSNFGEAFRRWSGITPSQWRSGRGRPHTLTNEPRRQLCSAFLHPGSCKGPHLAVCAHSAYGSLKGLTARSGPLSKARNRSI